MRKYYYYTYKIGESEMLRTTWSDSGEFEITEEIKELRQQHCRIPYITFWKEISSTQFEKLSKYFENQNK